MYLQLRKLRQGFYYKVQLGKKKLKLNMVNRYLTQTGLGPTTKLRAPNGLNESTKFNAS